MSEKTQTPFLNKRELAILLTVIVVTIGYIVTALMSKTIIAIFLLPVFLAPLVAIFFAGCRTCQLKVRHAVPSEKKASEAPHGDKVTRFFGYSIYLFLFIILALVLGSWLLKHFF